MLFLIDHDFRSWSTTIFSSEELKKFEKRFDNGYDLQHDERYNLWLKHFHGSSTAVIEEG